MHFRRMLSAILLLGGSVLLTACGAKKPVASSFMLQHTYTVRDEQFTRVMSDLMGPMIEDGNRIETFINGDEFYPAMLEAIRAAEQSITFETYFYQTSDIGKAFAEALAERARNGVKVRITLDAIGASGLTGEYLDMLDEAGASVVQYNPITRIALLITVGDVTQRTHRKLLVVDGKTGFIGGAGVADFWKGDARNEEEWRDTFYRVEGPVVAHLQAAFVDNWLQSKGELLDGEAYFAALEPVGDVAAQVFQSSPGGGTASMELMMLIAITAAEESIDMATPYFIPDQLLHDAMIAAMERGVRIRLMIPGPHLDHQITKVVSKADWDTLLEAGLELYEFQPSMMHMKLMVVDGYWASVGSANLDPLSFRLNDEANMNVYDEAFAREQIEMFEKDLERCDRVTEWEHAERSFLDRTLEFLAWPLRPIL